VQSKRIDANLSWRSSITRAKWTWTTNCIEIWLISTINPKNSAKNQQNVSIQYSSPQSMNTYFYSVINQRFILHALATLRDASANSLNKNNLNFIFDGPFSFLSSYIALGFNFFALLRLIFCLRIVCKFCWLIWSITL